MEEYKRGKNGEAPRAKTVGGAFRPEQKKDYDYSISSLYKIQGVLERDFFSIAVKHSGLFLWNEEKGECTHIELSDYLHGVEVGQMHATPNGEFLVVGFPAASKIFFFNILADMCTLRLVEP